MNNFGICQMQNLKSFQHNLVAPLLLLGTESRNNNTRQTFSQAVLLQVMQSAIFYKYLLALEFLRRFWNTDSVVTPAWLSFAREEYPKGLDFVAMRNDTGTLKQNCVALRLTEAAASQQASVKHNLCRALLIRLEHPTLYVSTSGTCTEVNTESSPTPESQSTHSRAYT
ncbi:uncharacterized protein PV06_01503 [Exophiala oligosperma]|uniref:Uncharacterized protein n=1 Tax=Exophiala oligosperma TaxID=215243 RepID=A0A0D2CGF7_9EURO|nr:uncharacterized protein PV06_01503 [Exophiala oligosperma]KIW48947.1 hypothetical protein PV06_01503 [Exophiala oligosperma]